MLGGMAAREPNATRVSPDSPAGRVAGRSLAERCVTRQVDVLGVRRPVFVSGSPDERIAAIAALQRGRISRAQLQAIALNDAAIHRRIRRGSLIREHRAVYAAGHAAPARLAAETAALLACGTGAALSHHSAALLYGIIPERLHPDVIHVTLPGRHGGQPRGVTVHRSGVLTPADIRVVDRLPVTSPAWTAVDLAERLGAPELERAVEEALLRRLLTTRDLEVIAMRAAGRRGAAFYAACWPATRRPASHARRPSGASGA